MPQDLHIGGMPLEGADFDQFPVGHVLPSLGKIEVPPVFSKGVIVAITLDAQTFTTAAIETVLQVVGEEAAVQPAVIEPVDGGGRIAYQVDDADIGLRKEPLDQVHPVA